MTARAVDAARPQLAPGPPIRRRSCPGAMRSAIMLLGVLMAAPPAIAGGGALSSCAMSDRGVHPPPKNAKPGYLETYADPSFGFTVTRVTGEPGKPTGCGKKWRKDSVHHYNTMPAWNADGSLLLIKYPPVFLDGQTYEPVCLHQPPTGDTTGIRPTPI